MGFLICPALLLLLFLLIPRPVLAAEAPDLYLLAIGVSHYRDPHIPTLRYADDDARAMERWAATQEGRVYRKIHTQVLVNEQATRPNVIDALVNFYRAASPRDQIVLFISGHGVVESRTAAYHFLTYDSDFNSIAGTALEQDDILKKLEAGNRPHNRVVTLIDTCQAGALATALPKDGKGLFLAGEVQALEDERVRDKTSVWVVYTAGTAADKTVEGPQYRINNEPADVEGHGVFTWAVLRALSSTEADLNHNGLVTLVEFQNFVSEQVKHESHGNQLPVMSGRQTDVALSFAVGTPEICDGLDNDLNGRIDEGFDHNGNGIGDRLEQEKCNGLDDNGDGRIDEGFDLDGDGHNSMELCGSRVGDDCDDHDISIHPGQKDWGTCGTTTATA